MLWCFFYFCAEFYISSRVYFYTYYEEPNCFEKYFEELFSKKGNLFWAILKWNAVNSVKRKIYLKKTC